jgi:hypothetical protein
MSNRAVILLQEQLVEIRRRITLVIVAHSNIGRSLNSVDNSLIELKGQETEIVLALRKLRNE